MEDGGVNGVKKPEANIGEFGSAKKREGKTGDSTGKGDTVGLALESGLGWVRTNWGSFLGVCGSFFWGFGCGGEGAHGNQFL